MKFGSVVIMFFIFLLLLVSGGNKKKKKTGALPEIQFIQKKIFFFFLEKCLEG